MVAAADRVAVDAGDHGLEEVFDAGVRVHRDLLALALDLLEPAHVAAGAESPVAGARDNQHPDLVVVRCVLHGGAHFTERAAGERVHQVGAVDRQPGGAADAMVLFVEDVLELGHAD